MSPIVYWAFESLPAPNPSDPAPGGLSWLSAQENAVLTGLRSRRRQEDWLTGRWMAKRLCRQVFSSFGHASLSLFEVLSYPSGAPSLRFPDGTRGHEGCLSLSHRAGGAACAVTPSNGLYVGIDIEWIESRSRGLVETFFTGREREVLATSLRERAADLYANVIWSAKEAVLKVMGVGLSVDTRSFSCLPRALGEGTAADGWNVVGIVAEPISGASLPPDLAVRWRLEGPFVVSAAAARSPAGSAKTSGEADPSPAGPARQRPFSPIFELRTL